MAELHVIGALRNKRAELAGTLRQLEQQLAGHRANLAHLDATMRLFDPNVRPKDIRPRQVRARNAWFRQGECLRLIYDALREATPPVTTRELKTLAPACAPGARGWRRRPGVCATGFRRAAGRFGRTLSARGGCSRRN